ncbi:MAG: inositol-phosphate phosphatase/L-galactose 1-phosphate phosphatase/histidinol-phosphatase [Gammaproteobacteria bacterium]
MSASSYSFQELSEFIDHLTKVSREVIAQYFRHPFNIDAKADETPVTIADRETERRLRQLINDRFPDHGIFGEEFGEENVDSKFVWVLDPIDGTRSFITGTPTFGTLISLLDNGTPILGVIDMPAMDERWIGDGKEGTTVNGSNCSVSHREQLDGCRLVSTSPDMFTAEQLVRFRKLLGRTSFYRYGGDCYNYALLASGHIDLVVESDLQLYDFSALVPVIEGAGGVITDWQGQPLTMQSKGDVVASASKALHSQAVELLS